MKMERVFTKRLSANENIKFTNLTTVLRTIYIYVR